MSGIKRRSFLHLFALALPANLFAKPLQTAAQEAKNSTNPAPASSASSPVLSGEDRYSFKRVLPNGTTTFKVSTKDCRGDFFAMEHHHTAKGGPPRHYHTVEDEWFYVIDGEYLVEVGGTLHRLKAGDSVLGPRGVPHAFAFVGPGSGRFLITYAPAGRMEEFFNTRDHAEGRTTYVFNAEKMRAFGMELVGPPLSVS